MKTGLMTMHVKSLCFRRGSQEKQKQAKNKDMANQFLLGENYY